MRPRVFTLEPCRQDIEDAKQYGDIVYLFNSDDTRSSIWSEEFTEEVLGRLETLRFDPDEDFFLVAGGIVPNFISGPYIAAHYGTFKVLLYDSTAKHYREKIVDSYLLSELED